MIVSNPDLVTILVLIMGAFVLAQAVGTAIFLRKAEKRIQKADRLLLKGRERVLGSLSSARRLLETLEGVQKTLPVVEEQVMRLLDVASRGARKAGEISSKGMHSAEARLEEVDRRTEYALSQFTRQTNRVRKGVRYPAKRISALLQGVLVGLQTYWEGQKDGPRKGLYEDEGFI